MIPFTAKRTEEVSLFFLDKQNVPDLKHLLKDNLITGWELHPLAHILPMLPHGTCIPNVYIDQYTDEPSPKTAIWCFVSYYNVDDMRALLWTLIEHPETKARHQAEMQQKLKQLEWEERWADDPAPWGLAINTNEEVHYDDEN